jgi:TonB family protein
MWPGQGSALRVPAISEEAEPVSAPKLLVCLEPRHRVFWSNFADLFRRRRQPPLRLISWPAAPWPDVFVSRRLPWKGLFESAAAHLIVIVSLVWLAPLFPHRTVSVVRPTFNKEDVIYYAPSEYLPPLDTGNTHAAKAGKGDPVYAPQPIISVPPEADNRSQTIVTPPAVKLDHDVPLPNMVAWSPPSVAVSMAATARRQLQVPSLSAQVVAPAPDLNRATERQAPSLQAAVAAPAPEVKNGLARQALLAPEASVVAPPPSMNVSSSRRLGEINIGHSDVVAPAPQLPVGEQRVVMASGRVVLSGGGAPAVVAPPPAVEGLGSARSAGGQVIALNVRPVSPSAAAPVPAGNRRGTFAAGPSGKAEATGTPETPEGAAHSSQTSGDSRSGNGSGAGTASLNGVPSGLRVGAAPKETPSSAVGGRNSSDKTLTASVTTPSSHTAARAVAPENATEADRRIFGDRKFYSMTLNLPNLNSSGGSWVIRFAEMSENKEPGELSGPAATQTSDPAYPMDLMRKNVQGTVVLYAVIHSDGTVGEVRVLDGVNDRLDEYARAALLQWHFRPASRNGNPITVEAVVRVPFKPFHFKSSF